MNVRRRFGGGLAFLCACLLAPGVSFGDESSMLFEKPWRWSDEHGRSVGLSQWGGAPLVVTMFYAKCRFRCPRTIDKLKEIDAAYGRRSVRASFVLITLDPHSDTPQELAALKRARHLPEDSWHLLAGDEGPTRALARVLGIHPAYDDGHVDHEVRIAILDASGHLARLLEGWDFDANEATR